MGLSLPRANGPRRRRGADAPVHGALEPARGRCRAAGSQPALSSSLLVPVTPSTRLVLCLCGDTLENKEVLI